METRHIVIVDDDTIGAAMLKEHLETMNFTVSLVEDCKQAKQALENPLKIDLIILDYLLPDGNGTEFLQAISKRKDLQKPPVVIASSIIEPHNTSWHQLFRHLSLAAQNLVTAFVTKPYSFEGLGIVLDNTLKTKAVKTQSGQALMGDYLSPLLPHPPKEAV